MSASRVSGCLKLNSSNCIPKVGRETNDWSESDGSKRWGGKHGKDISRGRAGNSPIPRPRGSLGTRLGWQVQKKAGYS